MTGGGNGKKHVESKTRGAFSSRTARLLSFTTKTGLHCRAETERGLYVYIGYRNVMDTLISNYAGSYGPRFTSVSSLIRIIRFRTFVVLVYPKRGDFRQVYRLNRRLCVCACVWFTWFVVTANCSNNDNDFTKNEHVCSNGFSANLTARWQNKNPTTSETAEHKTTVWSSSVRYKPLDICR